MTKKPCHAIHPGTSAYSLCGLHLASYDANYAANLSLVDCGLCQQTAADWVNLRKGTPWPVVIDALLEADRVQAVTYFVWKVNS